VRALPTLEGPPRRFSVLLTAVPTRRPFPIPAGTPITDQYTSGALVAGQRGNQESGHA